MSTHISKVTIEGFRGIPTAQSVDFFNASTSKYSSLLLLGDNGTGKSSIVDAIEFVLQSRIKRKTVNESNEMPFPASLVGGVLPKVEVEFSDETVFSRGMIFLKKSQKWRNSPNNKPHPSFSLTPIALRRADILSFWSTPPHQRIVVFIDFVREQSIEHKVFPPSVQEEIEKIQNERLLAKKKRREIAERIAAHLRIDANSIPIKDNDFGLFVRDTVHGGISKKQRNRMQRKGLRFKTDMKLEPLLREMRETILNIQVLSTQLKALQNPSDTRSARSELVKGVIERVSERITDSFLQISSSSHFVDRLEVIVGLDTAVSMDILVHLKNGLVKPVFIDPKIS